MAGRAVLTVVNNHGFNCGGAPVNVSLPTSRFGTVPGKGGGGDVDPCPLSPPQGWAAAEGFVRDPHRARPHPCCHLADSAETSPVLGRADREGAGQGSSQQGCPAQCRVPGAARAGLSRLTCPINDDRRQIICGVRSAHVCLIEWKKGVEQSPWGLWECSRVQRGHRPVERTRPWIQMRGFISPNPRLLVHLHIGINTTSPRQPGR